MSEYPNTRDCIFLFGVLPVCKEDIIKIYPRGMRSLMMITGKVEQIGDNALLVRMKNGNLMVIRLSEIRMVEKISEGNNE